MSYKIYSFEKLDVYQAARKFKIDIKKMSSLFPKEERFDLISQMNRASASISANLAEGSGRSSNFDQAHFTNISYASGLETIDHLNTALDMEYINREKYTTLRVDLDTILRKLNALYKFQINNNKTLKKKM
ncbi:MULTISPECIES: four helix bundle protein [unclassified Polaribacter]|uniref:four helix bundle protein n=1 Tax=unclassified Polaribacter TaxID=196858 RepID=UPI000CB7E5D3|nr:MULTISPECIES: four helix bundle protein [unclassified Polaribacter]PKV65431.1 four helix bundle protein [Polaribacter sp. Hel1_33_96]